MNISSCVQLHILMALLKVYAIYLPGFQNFSHILLFLSLLILKLDHVWHLLALTSFPEILRMGQNVFLKGTIFFFDKFYKREEKHNFSLLSVFRLLFVND